MPPADREVELAAAYATALRELTLLLREWDPQGFEEAGAPPDEYEPIAAHLLPRLARASGRGMGGVQVELRKIYQPVPEAHAQRAAEIVAPLAARSDRGSR